MDGNIAEKNGPQRIDVFCCYARKDQPLLLELEAHLMPLQREGLITLWADKNIDAGTEWEKEIHQHLNTAHLILLLVSPDFMASEYCYSVEMQRALERHKKNEACVLPIILRSVSWEGAPFSQLQVLPTNARPATSSEWHNRDEAFLDIARGIRHTVDKLQKQSSDKSKASFSASNPTPNTPLLKQVPVSSEAGSSLRTTSSSLPVKHRIVPIWRIGLIVGLVGVVVLSGVGVLVWNARFFQGLGHSLSVKNVNGTSSNRSGLTPTSLNGKWNIGPVQTLGRDDTFTAISASSAASVWAVGTFGMFSSSPGGGFMAHWIGTRWQMAQSPQPSAQGDQMAAVLSLSTSDVWAIGTYTCPCTGFRAVMDHWDGSSWKLYRGPNPTDWNTYFAAAAGSASNDVWAVGSYVSDIKTEDTQPLFEHWNGTAWSIVASPHINASASSLAGITTISAQDAWAIGNYGSSDGSNKALLEHWNGKTWQQATVIYPQGAQGVFFNGITHIPNTSQLWIVGTYNTGPGTTWQAFTEMYDGTRWSIIASPKVPKQDSIFTAVCASAPNSAWAVGRQGTHNLNQGKTLIEYWNGANWTIVPSPNPSTRQNNDLVGVIQIPGSTEALAVGVNDYANSVAGFASFSEWYHS